MSYHSVKQARSIISQIEICLLATPELTLEPSPTRHSVMQATSVEIQMENQHSGVTQQI